jgi:hypothetical protein
LFSHPAGGCGKLGRCNSRASSRIAVWETLLYSEILLRRVAMLIGNRNVTVVLRGLRSLGAPG